MSERLVHLDHLEEELQRLAEERMERIRNRHRCRPEFERRRKAGKAIRHRRRLARSAPAENHSHSRS